MQPGNHHKHRFIYFHCQTIQMYFPSTSKSYASLVRQIVALEGGNDGQSCHSLSDSVAWHHSSDAPHHPPPPLPRSSCPCCLGATSRADPPKVPSMPLMKGAASPPLAPLSTRRTNFLRSGTKRVGALTLKQPLSDSPTMQHYKVQSEHTLHCTPPHFH